MSRKDLQCFVTRSADVKSPGTDLFIGPVQSVRIEPIGPETPTSGENNLVTVEGGAKLDPYPLSRARRRAIIVDEATDWIMPANQTLLRYGKQILEQSGEPGKHWHTVTGGKGVKCLWSDVEVGDIIRIGSS